MNINGGKKLTTLKNFEPKRALKPILPKLPSYSIDQKRRNYELHPDESFNGYGTCYVCDVLFHQGVRLWGAQTTGTGLATKIGQLLGDKYAVVVNADDVLCHKCFSLLIHIDALEDELRQVRQLLRGYLVNKYHIDDTPVDEEHEIQTDPTVIETKQPILLEGKRPKTKSIHRCNMCGLQLESLRALRKHNIVAHLTTWTCHFCNQVFDEEKLFTDHTKLHLTDSSIAVQETIDNVQLEPDNVFVEHLDENLCSVEMMMLTCDLCGVDFQHADAYNEHMHTHQVLLDLESLDKPEALSLDGFGGNPESVDLMDMNIFDNSDSVDQTVKRFICADCNLAHETQEEMTIHMQTVHHINPCYLCSDFFGTKAEIETHLAEMHANETDTTWLLHTDKQTVTCGFCDTLLEGDDEFERHSQECELKPKELEAEELSLGQDVVEPQIFEGESEEEIITNEPTCSEDQIEDTQIRKTKRAKRSRNVTCIQCGEVFDDKQSMLRHELDNPSHFSLSCPDCDASFGKDKDLNDHRELAHTIIRCRWCSKTFKNIKQIKSHETRHVRSLSTVYDCEVCHRIFQTPTGLRYHMLTHTGNYKFTCEFCGKGFAARARHEEHRATHTKEKRYTCEICGVKFSVQATYWIHRKWHDNPKPYKCGQCGMFFKHSSMLSVHKRKHTGERPYACPYCVQTFSVSNSLKRHLTIHTGTFPYFCQLCDIGFPARHKYAQHMSKVHDDDTLLLEQIKKKTRDLVMAIKEPEKEKMPEPDETWVLTDGLSTEPEQYLTLETVEGEKILLAGDNQIQIIYQDDQNLENEDESILSNITIAS